MINVRIEVDGVTSNVQILETEAISPAGRSAQDFCDAVQKTATLAVARAQAAIKAEQQLYGRQAV